MILIENVDVWGFEHAIRGMRNPMNSWDRSDSLIDKAHGKLLQLGDNDLKLMQKLYAAGHPHRKYLRQIMVSMDIIAPLYWWKEFDTYKIGTVANSCSTMHTIHKRAFEMSDFSWDNLLPDSMKYLESLIYILNGNRERYLETKRKVYWWQIIQLLPSSYNQKRTITMNYENILNMIEYREGHKLDEWNMFCEEMKKLPYIKEIINHEN